MRRKVKAAQFFSRAGNDSTGFHPARAEAFSLHTCVRLAAN
jgi:hypothetical protein